MLNNIDDIDDIDAPICTSCTRTVSYNNLHAFARGKSCSCCRHQQQKQGESVKERAKLRRSRKLRKLLQRPRLWMDTLFQEVWSDTMTPIKNNETGNHRNCWTVCLLFGDLPPRSRSFHLTTASNTLCASLRAVDVPHGTNHWNPVSHCRRTRRVLSCLARTRLGLHILSYFAARDKLRNIETQTCGSSTAFDMALWLDAAS